MSYDEHENTLSQAHCVKIRTPMRGSERVCGSKKGHLELAQLQATMPTAT